MTRTTRRHAALAVAIVAVLAVVACSSPRQTAPLPSSPVPPMSASEYLVWCQEFAADRAGD